MQATAVLPKGIKQLSNFAIEINWNDEHRSVFDVRKLRLACPCANCVDERTGKKTLQDDAVAENVKPQRIQSVGRYAMNITWSDGHNTGIYTYEKLRQLCDCEVCQGKPFALRM